jgi:preprotein translocase subunit SecA
MLDLLKKYFPSYNDKEIKIYQKIVEKINKSEEVFLEFNEGQFLEKTNFFKKELES